MGSLHNSLQDKILHRINETISTPSPLEPLLEAV